MSEAATRHGRAPPLAASRRGLFVGLASLATALGCGDGTADLPSSLGSAAEEGGRSAVSLASGAAGGKSFVVVRTDYGGSRGWTSASLDGSRQPLVDHGIDPAIWGRDTWGAHIYWDPTPPRAAAGSGPWTGQYYADGPPGAGQVRNEIRIHPDFVASGPKYAGASQIPDTLCASAASLPHSSGVRIVNDACGNKKNFDDWKDMVVAHEQVHAANLAYCLSAAGTKRLLAELEEMIGEDENKLNGDLGKKWDKYYLDIVQPVSRGVTSVSWSPRIFDHRKRSRWTLSSWPVEAHAGLPRSRCDT